MALSYILTISCFLTRLFFYFASKKCLIKRSVLDKANSTSLFTWVDRTENVSWPFLSVDRSTACMWSWHKLDSKEKHKCRYFTRSDFLKGTRYEELATTFGSGISRHSYLHVFRVSWFFFGVAKISSLKIYPKLSCESRADPRPPVYQSSGDVLKFLIQLFSAPTIFSLEFKLVSSAFDRLSKSVVPAIMRCCVFRKNWQIWRAPEKRKELSDWREGISGTRLVRQFLQTTL